MIHLTRRTTKWISQSVTKDNIMGGTYTVENATGGSWSATRVNEGSE